MRVRDLMTAPAVVVPQDATLAEVARLMVTQGIGCVPVVDPAGRLTGIVTESDFGAREEGIPFSFAKFPKLLGQWIEAEGVEPLYHAARTMTAGEIATRPVFTVREDDTIDQAVQLFMRLDVRRLPVVRGELVVGVLARRDLLRLVAGLAPRTA